MQENIEHSRTRKTYPQDWVAYNAAQTSEKEHFLKLLHSLCAGIAEPKQTNGRPRIPLSDAIFSICFKIYSTVSARRFMSDLREAKVKGYISRTPHFNSIFNYLEKRELTSILKNLIIQTSLPLASVEEKFAVDSSGFTTCNYIRWRDCKYGQKKLQEWVKVHLMCGVKTNIVTAVEIYDKSAADCPQLPALLHTTADRFEVKEVSADKAYSSYGTYAIIDKYGALPLIPFKKTSTPKAGGVWERMFYYFKFNQQDFMKRYHRRSNVETTFAMIKAKFGGYVRSKTPVAVKNECYAKILNHNICVLIQEMHELGINPQFEKVFEHQAEAFSHH